MSCDQPVKETQTELDFPYEPTYPADNWKIGSQESVLLVQNLHKAIVSGDIDTAYSYMSEDVTVWHGDGSTTNNLQEFKDMYDESLRAGIFSNYSVTVNIPVISESGEEWVLVWDRTDAGEDTFDYMEAFRVQDGKVVAMNQFSKPVLDDDSDEDHDGDDNDGKDHHDGDDND